MDLFYIFEIGIHNAMKNTFLTLAMLGNFLLMSLHAQDFKVNINKLTEQTQKLSESPDKMCLVWWIPIEFWETIFDQDQSIDKKQSDDILMAFSQYSMFVIIDGTILEDGNITYKSRDKTFENLVLTDVSKKKYAPLLEDEIDDKTKELIITMKPILGNTLGKIGENMHFFLFQKKGNPLDPIINAKAKENFTVTVNKEDFIWSLPLGALLKPKKCPEDGAQVDGSWSFCPYHGKKLVADN